LRSCHTLVTELLSKIEISPKEFMFLQIAVAAEVKLLRNCKGGGNEEA
jgi:hypothetical protein